jgi:hypothetical protein
MCSELGYPNLESSNQHDEQCRTFVTVVKKETLIQWNGMVEPVNDASKRASREAAWTKSYNATL